MLASRSISAASIHGCGLRFESRRSKTTARPGARLGRALLIAVDAGMKIPNRDVRRPKGQLRASICRVPEWAKQQRDVVTDRMLRSAFDHFEGDAHRRIERVRPARLEVLASIEHESVDAGFEGRVIVHQCALPAILVSLSMAESPPLAVLAALLEDDPQARGRTTNRRIEHVRGDCAHEGNCSLLVRRSARGCRFEVW